MLDFKELGANGRAFEQLLRELALTLGLDVAWSGVGPDDEHDLIIEERGDVLFGATTRRWLVSAKDYSSANSGQGRAVSSSDVADSGGIRDALDHHAADGFLLACTTYPSSALVRRFDSIRATRRIPLHTWDSVAIERLLDTPAGWAVLQRFLPNSADALGWRVFATESPNRYVGVTRGMWFRLTGRYGGAVKEFHLTSVAKRIDFALARTLPDDHQLRLRGVFYDDKNGSFTSHWDYLWQHEAPSVDAIQRMVDYLGDGQVRFKDGQTDWVTVDARRVFRQSDNYDADSPKYYEQLPSYW